MTASESRRRSGSREGMASKPTSLMMVRHETAKTPGETGAWSPERPKRTCASTLRSRGASPPAGMLRSWMTACLGGVSAVAVEALMSDVG